MKRSVNSFVFVASFSNLKSIIVIVGLHCISRQQSVTDMSYGLQIGLVASGF